MAIKFTAKDQPAAPAAAKTPAAKTDREPVAAKDETTAGVDLFDPDAKTPAGKRKSK